MSASHLVHDSHGYQNKQILPHRHTLQLKLVDNVLTLSVHSLHEHGSVYRQHHAMGLTVMGGGLAPQEGLPLNTRPSNSFTTKPRSRYVWNAICHTQQPVSRRTGHSCKRTRRVRSMSTATKA